MNGKETTIYSILEMLESGNVTRFHSATTVNNQQLGQHVFGAALLAWYLDNGCAALPDPALMAKALTHDVAELHTGDVPYTVKAQHPGVKQYFDTLERKIEESMGVHIDLTTQQELILKLADMVEGVAWTQRNEAPPRIVQKRWLKAIEVALESGLKKLQECTSSYNKLKPTWRRTCLLVNAVTEKQLLNPTLFEND